MARFVFGLLFVVSFPAFAQTLSIGLFNDVELKSIVVSHLKGRYKVYADSAMLMELSKDDALYVSQYGSKLMVRNLSAPLGTFKTLRIAEVDTGSVFRLLAVTPKADAREYSNSVSFSVAFGRILAVNEVQMNNYVAGVVEAETEANALLELYKAQSILARTFLYGHLGRHSNEGFDLCDGVHCQAYKGRSMRNPAIPEATRLTSSQVVLAPDTTYITAFFHANCGGETESAYNAWLIGKTYLVSVKDPFCQNSNGAQWVKKIPTEQWRKYLTEHGFKVSKKTTPIRLDFQQITRKQYYKVGKDSIPFKQIRTDFQLRSSFFSVIADDKEVTLKGKGYGHGVGMCQEGAMQMAKIGYKYDEILNYYFKGVRIGKVGDARLSK